MSDHAPEKSLSEEEGSQSGGDIFFTDVKGKRKADHQSPKQSARPARPSDFTTSKSAAPKSSTPASSGQVPHKRFKYDEVANNADFVTFASSDDEGNDEEGNDSYGSRDSEEIAAAEVEAEDDDEVASSVDSEELRSVIMDEPFVDELEQTSISPLADDNSCHSLSPPPLVIKPRRRSDLLEGEDPEEGEIFDDDEDDDHGASQETSDSEGEDEGIERQLLGDRKSWRS